MLDPKIFFENPEQIGLNYSSLYIIPTYSDISTRGEVDTSVHFGKMKLKIGVLSANMDSVTEEEMLYAMHKGGGAGVLHRFLSIERSIEIVKKAVENEINFFVSVGVGQEEKDRFKALYEAGAKYFVVDIAHGHSESMKNMLSYIRKNYPSNVYVIAGNVTTQEAVFDLVSWGANACKIGIGGGAVCLTKNVTGVTIPMASAIAACVKDAHVPIIADGGIREIADICKAFGLGASAVMTGYMFAGTQETPNGGESYRGMASAGAMKVQASLKNYDQARKIPTPEGTVVSTHDMPNKGKEANIVCEEIAGGLRSSLSYCGARSLKEFHPKFGIKL